MSGVINPKQLTVKFEGGLIERFRNLREAVAQGVYRRGLKRVSADIDMAPGNLSAALADDAHNGSHRKIGLDELERYFETSRDMTPLYYLIERFLGDPLASEAARREQALEVIANLPELIAAAGLSKTGRAR